MYEADHSFASVELQTHPTYLYIYVALLLQHHHLGLCVYTEDSMLRLQPNLSKKDSANRIVF
jgi:hypothetical protein